MCLPKVFVRNLKREEGRLGDERLRLGNILDSLGLDLLVLVLR